MISYSFHTSRLAVSAMAVLISVGLGRARLGYSDRIRWPAVALRNLAFGGSYGNKINYMNTDYNTSQ
jgi:hypothetical protein